MSPSDFNERGQVIGADFGPEGYTRGWYWSKKTGTVLIPSSGETYPSAINKHGTVAGSYFDLRAFLWRLGGNFTDLGTPPGGNTWDTRLAAQSLNDFDHVVGWIQSWTYSSAFVWSEAEGFTLLPGPSSYATGINKGGLIVGAGWVDGRYQPSAWPTSTTILGLSGSSPYGGIATAVNDRDQVVGWMGVDNTNTGANHAMLWVISSNGKPAAVMATASPDVAPALVGAGPADNAATSCLSDFKAIASKAGLIRCTLGMM
jgi:hypothetical protein